MCRQFIIAGKLSSLRDLLKITYNEDIRLGLVERIREYEKDLEEEIEKEIKRKYKDAMLTQYVPVISFENGEKVINEMKWGIVFDKEKKTPLIFNSRDDTIKTRPFWLNLFDKNRILVPMTGFYEWRDTGEKKKRKTEITLKSKNMFMVPGLYRENIKGEKEFTIITTSPNEFIKNIHNRMPVIFTDKNVYSYFTDSAEENHEKLKPLNEEMEAEEVE